LIRKPCHLSDRAVIGVSGPEAFGFLQGVVTNDVTKLTQQPLYAALLSPQGKILFDFILHAHNDTILIDVQKDQRAPLAKRLSMYKLRAQVEIASRDDLIVIADEGPDDPRLAALGQRSIAASGAETVDGAGAYHEWRFGLGVPEAADFGSEKLFAMDGGLDELHAISFTKGCYVGQELTARMKHRGTDRKRLVPFSAPEAELEIGAAIIAGDIEIGSVMASYGDAGFALVRLDRLAEAPGPLRVAGAEISIIKPDWLFT
jgi:tRNA-modifying protein YgfZ